MDEPVTKKRYVLMRDGGYCVGYFDTHEEAIAFLNFGGNYIYLDEGYSIYVLDRTLTLDQKDVVVKKSFWR